ncbi:EEF1A lysine methyltransferase 1 isoform X1 [Hemicordylus capensis]|uniref:EEF1A lysine methyltransferase 1 isoform X1 n=1 Tax=Hemicordylus capensis TaxID=884348 RepID=UPI002303C192|nr:EEF1A lysine methyltransferase 1 isoform X1 [Hemicordylus capensis]XP_053166164.1 EEF1A lysine methyltransferase 1 isoform X1 [Hemicordylus capensis]
MSDSDDDMPQLSSQALAALQEFYNEQQQREDSKTTAKINNYSLGSIEENWQLSQFWYDTDTALCLADEAIRAAGKGGRIACVSAPSIYQKLKEQASKDFSACILEYDQRFSVYGTEYVFYDYNNPLNLPANLTAHSFDIVLADPPYLSEECLRKTAETIKYLTKGKILLCTGNTSFSASCHASYTMRDLIVDLLSCVVRPCSCVAEINGLYFDLETSWCLLIPRKPPLLLENLSVRNQAGWPTWKMSRAKEQFHIKLMLEI